MIWISCTLAEHRLGVNHLEVKEFVDNKFLCTGIFGLVLLLQRIRQFIIRLIKLYTLYIWHSIHSGCSSSTRSYYDAMHPQRSSLGCQCLPRKPLGALIHNMSQREHCKVEQPFMLPPLKFNVTEFGRVFTVSTHGWYWSKWNVGTKRHFSQNQMMNRKKIIFILLDIIGMVSRDKKIGKEEVLGSRVRYSILFPKEKTFPCNGAYCLWQSFLRYNELTTLDYQHWKI